jgi:Polysaccharide biosynthesis enzyme WcbI
MPGAGGSMPPPTRLRGLLLALRSRPPRQWLAAGWRRALRMAQRSFGLPGAVSRDDVIWAFRTLLGRAPESEGAITAHQDCLSFRQLVTQIAASPEFEQRTANAALMQRRARPLHDAAAQALPAMLVSANCTTPGVAAALQQLTGAEVVNAVPAGDIPPEERRARLQPYAGSAGLWVVLPGDHVSRDYFASVHAPGARLLTMPAIVFPAFHPDVCHVQDRRTGKPIHRRYNSAIAVWAYQHGLDVPETAALFRRETYRALGYLDAWNPAVESMRRAFAASDLRDRFGDFMLHVKRQGCFMHTPNHPKIDVLVQLARQVARQAELPLRHAPQAGELADGLNAVVWPIYPEIAQALALPNGGYTWKMIIAGRYIDGPQAYVQSSFDNYRELGLAPGDMQIRFHDTRRLDLVLGELTRGAGK